MALFIRWGVNIAEWNPSKEEFDNLLDTVEPEEKIRIYKYLKETDRKLTLAGRLMIRKGLSTILNIPLSELKVGRTPYGKPMLENDISNTAYKNLSFNLTHHGDYVLFVCHSERKIGIDVLRYDPPRKPIPEYFRLMNNCFTKQEWNEIKEEENEMNQLKRFQQFWTLKEAYTKSLGIGLGFDVQRVTFHMTNKNEKVIKSTAVVDNSPVENFDFYTFDIDDMHVVSIVLDCEENSKEREEYNYDSLKFEYKNPNDLI